MGCVVPPKWKPKLGILAGGEAGEHENGVVNVWVSADLAPPGSHDARNIEAKKEGEKTGQLLCSTSPLSISCLRPLSATLEVLSFGKLKLPVGPQNRQASVGVWAFLTFRLVPDIAGAKIAQVPLVVQLHQVVEDEKEDREQDHPDHGEVKGSQVTPESTGVGDGFAPGPTSLPRGPLDFASPGQEVSDPKN